MLTLGSNQIQAWSCISALSQYNELRELRVSGNPVIVAGGSASRYQVSALKHQLSLRAWSGASMSLLLHIHLAVKCFVGKLLSLSIRGMIILT